MPDNCVTSGHTEKLIVEYKLVSVLESDTNERKKLNFMSKVCSILLNFQCIYIFQSVIFHVEYHPYFSWYAQGVTFNFFPTPGHELAYNLFNIIMIYGLPLVVIVVSYALILLEMTKKTKERQGKSMLL